MRLKRNPDWYRLKMVTTPCRVAHHVFAKKLKILTFAIKWNAFEP